MPRFPGADKGFVPKAEQYRNRQDTEIDMVTIRLARGGAKKRPYYHIVAADSRSPRDGRYIERLGFFNPIAKGQEEPLRIDLERVDHWLSQGARMTERVEALVKQYRKQGQSEAA